MKKVQVGIEFLLVITFILIVTSVMSVSMIQRNQQVVIEGRAIITRNNCEEFSDAVTQVLKLNGMRRRFYNYYNMTVDGVDQVVTLEHEEGVVFCPLMTKNVVNNTGHDLFVMSDGEYYVKNINGVVVVEQV